METCLGPESCSFTRKFYKPLPDNKTELLFNIDGLVDGKYNNQDILVIISSKPFVHIKNIIELKIYITEIYKYLELLKNKNGFSIKIKN